MLKVKIDDKTKSDLHERERLLLQKGDSGGARRIRIIIMSSNGFSVRDIALALSISKQTVRRAIHTFRRDGMDALSTKPRCGAPSKLTAEVLDTIYNIARQAPRHLVSDNPKYESNTWTIRMLKAYLKEYHNLD